MKNMMLHIEYRAVRYEDHRMLPQSAQTRSDALYAILRHAGAVGALMDMVDESKIDETTGNSLHLMMSNLGELIHLLTEAGMTILNEDDNDEADSMFAPHLPANIAHAREVA
ncbi:MAG TPA: hypothetical protein VGB07_08290 [Blastocatellia bacterium]